MSANPTSEEKLLKLIRNADADASKKGNKNKSGKSSSWGGAASEKIYRNVLRGVNIVLIVLIPVLMALVFYKFWKGDQASVYDVQSETPQGNAPIVSKLPALLKAGELDQYSAKLSKRDFFQFPEDTTELIGTPVQSGNFMYQQWSIVGILMEDSPQVVMEDPDTKQTIFLSQGDFIGDAQLKEVSEEKVIFSHKGELVEMTY